MRNLATIVDPDLNMKCQGPATTRLRFISFRVPVYTTDAAHKANIRGAEEPSHEEGYRLRRTPPRNRSVPGTGSDDPTTGVPARQAAQKQADDHPGAPEIGFLAGLERFGPYTPPNDLSPRMFQITGVRWALRPLGHRKAKSCPRTCS